MLTSVELFAGAGGLGIGLSLAGFQHLAVVERDRWACDTIRENQNRSHPLVASWPLFQGDVRDFDYGTIDRAVDVVAGGPPCQPFSVAGKHGAYSDERDMFPATVDVIRRLRPRAFIVENVRGLLRESFATYLAYILLRLEYPEVRRDVDEAWDTHLRRLQRLKSSGRHEGLTYNVLFQVVNAADYGVPQQRHRVFMVGFRKDIGGAGWAFPRPTHSQASLATDQWVTGEYWERHRIPQKQRPQPPLAIAGSLGALKQRNLRPTDERWPWRTVRDAFEGLPDPERDPDAARGVRDHRFQPGVKFYPGHTGSPLDAPAKALKAGDHGVPGGENALVRPDGSGRYFTAREAARLQTFPDAYVFHGAWSEVMRQLGNAVPVTLAQVVAASVARRLLEHDMLALAEAARV